MNLIKTFHILKKNKNIDLYQLPSPSKLKIEWLKSQIYNFKLFWNNKIKGPKQHNQNQLWSPTNVWLREEIISFGNNYIGTEL